MVGRVRANLVKNLFLDNVDRSSKKVVKMVSADANTDLKQEIKELLISSCIL